MDKLSQLLNEAKPLYKTRKRNKMIAKAVFCVSMPLFLFGMLIELNNLGDNVYVSMDNNTLQEELLDNDYGL